MYIYHRYPVGNYQYTSELKELFKELYILLRSYYENESDINCNSFYLGTTHFTEQNCINSTMYIFEKILEYINQGYLEQLKSDMEFKLNSKICELENVLRERLRVVDQLTDEIIEMGGAIALTSSNFELRNNWEQLIKKRNDK